MEKKNETKSAFSSKRWVVAVQTPLFVFIFISSFLFWSCFQFPERKEPLSLLNHISRMDYSDGGATGRMELKRRKRYARSVSRSSSDEEDSIGLSLSLVAQQQQVPLSRSDLPSSSSSPLPDHYNSKGNRKRVLSPSQRRQVLMRQMLFTILLVACIASFLWMFEFGIFSADEEPAYYTLSSAPPPSHDMLRRWQTQDGESSSSHPPVIHILHTRFMQHQGPLRALAQARLLLFRVFCLPTILHQSTQHFLWIIKVDPLLDPDVLQQLIHLLEDYDNIFVMGSQVNFLVNPNITGDWRDAEIRQIQEGDGYLDNSFSARSNNPPNTTFWNRIMGQTHRHNNHPAHIYSGSRHMLAMAMALSQELTVVETRLDADDGLHKDYMEFIQKQAVQHFQEHPHSTYKYWCSRQSLEWHWEFQSPTQRTTHDKYSSFSSYGSLQIMRHSHMCITPGITVAYAPGVNSTSVPVVEHHKLLDRLTHHVASHKNVTQIAVDDVPDCGADECIEFVEGQFAFDAIRSRTPTSAGMDDILRTNANHPMLQKQLAPSMQYNFWAILYSSFFIAREQVGYVQYYLQGQRLYEIARDNLLGQCTALHSCKVQNSLREGCCSPLAASQPLCLLFSRRKWRRTICINF